LGCYPQNLVFADILTQLGIDYVFQDYIGDHSSKLPERFPISIVFLVGLKAEIAFNPTKLNLKSNDNWVTCHSELPGGYSAADIDPSTVVLSKINGIALDPPLYREGPYSVSNHNGNPRLMVKFNRQALIAHLINMGIGDGETVELSVAGELASSLPFHDVGAITVINRGGGAQGSYVSGNPESYFLYQSKPNPFEHTTIIQYDLPRATRVKVSIYNLIGQRIVTLVDAHQVAGNYSVCWDGNKLANGAYICRLETDNYTATQKILITR